MQAARDLAEVYQSITKEAERLAGGLNDLAQRAAVYHHLFEHSGRNLIFPLVAAHGALWARGYFRFGMKLGGCCSWLHAASPEWRQQRLAQLAAFADAFRDINRRVCIDTYAAYHFTLRYGRHPSAGTLVAEEILQALQRCHHARMNGRTLTDQEKREVFEAFFLNEQATIVGPSIQSATAAFEWPLMKFLALRPIIHFAYFPRSQFLRFRNFADQRERVENGLRAFDLGARAGWQHVEGSLRRYAIMPTRFFDNSRKHFAAIQAGLSTG